MINYKRATAVHYIYFSEHDHLILTLSWIALNSQTRPRDNDQPRPTQRCIIQLSYLPTQTDTQGVSLGAAKSPTSFEKLAQSREKGGIYV